jgi:hypothetical protein
LFPLQALTSLESVGLEQALTSLESVGLEQALTSLESVGLEQDPLQPLFQQQVTLPVPLFRQQATLVVPLFHQQVTLPVPLFHQQATLTSLESVSDKSVVCLTRDCLTSPLRLTLSTLWLLCLFPDF